MHTTFRILVYLFIELPKRGYTHPWPSLDQHVYTCTGSLGQVFIQGQTAKYSYRVTRPSIHTGSHGQVFIQGHTAKYSYRITRPSIHTGSHGQVFIQVTRPSILTAFIRDTQCNPNWTFIGVLVSRKYELILFYLLFYFLVHYKKK